MHHRFLALLALAAPAAAQVQPVSFESFDYPTPALLHAQSGGSGWATDWDVDPNSTGTGMQNAVVVFDTSVMPSFPIADPIGNYAGQAIEFLPAARSPSPQNQADIHDGFGFGRDGGTMWISFRTWNYQNFGDHFGALILINDSTGTDVEEVVLGSPWATYGWGIDDEGPMGALPEIATGSDSQTPARLVYRIDYMPGQERIRMWIDPAVPHPTTAPALDQMIHDHRWQEIHLISGGQGSHYFWDEIIIEKGEPAQSGIGTNYCGPAVTNATGVAGTIEGIGSGLLGVNNLTLRADSLPQNSFGFFLTSRMQGFVMNPGGSRGNLCLSGAIGRYVGPGQIQNSGTAGSFELLLNLQQMPTPNGLVPAMAGETWNFQTWYRDLVGATPTSNFTDGLSVTF